MTALRHKEALKRELCDHLQAALDQARAAYAAAVEAATHPEARAENDKDTRGLEQSYVARGQAQRVADLELELAEVHALAVRSFGGGDPIGVGALVTADEDGDERRYFIAPHGGGAMLAAAIQVVTPRSPLGRALVGRRAGDAVELTVARKNRALEILSIE